MHLNNPVNQSIESTVGQVGKDAKISTFLLVIFTALMALLLPGYYIGKKRSIRLSDKSNQRLHSLPQHYGLLKLYW
jgi:hypothetical protein